ncbi:MAG: hypothetical protein WEA99_09155 [Brumimicrobium sp.]
MNKTLLLLLVIFSQFHFFTLSQTDKYPLSEYGREKFDLKGDVKSSEYKLYEPALSDDGELIKGEQKIKQSVGTPDYMYFTKNGFIDSTISYRDLTDKIRVYKTFKFNEAGYPIRRNQYLSDGTIKFYELYNYNDEHLLVQLEHHSYGLLQIKYDFIYNNSGNLTFEIRTNYYHPENDYSHQVGLHEDMVDTLKNYVYDDNNQLITSSPGKSYEKNYTYNANGELESVIYNNENSYTKKRIYNDSITYVTYRGNDVDSVVEYLDNLGNTIKKIYFRNGTFNKAKLKEYKYDEHGNWTFMICQNVDEGNRRKTWIEERIITYFD